MTTEESKLSLVEDELNPRWAKFIDLYLESGNAKQSAIDAGFTENYADVITSRFPDKVRKSLAEALEHKGVTPDKIAEKIGWLLNHRDYQAVDKGINHAAKIGIGGGYAPEKSVNVNATVTGDIKDFEKYQALKDEFETKLLDTLQSES